MTQGLAGVPVAVPMQSNHGMVTLQTVTPGAQEGQPQMVLVPVSGADGNQSQLVQVVPYATMASSYQTHQIPMPPPSYEEAQCATQENRRVGLKPVKLASFRAQLLFGWCHQNSDKIKNFKKSTKRFSV